MRRQTLEDEDFSSLGRSEGRRLHAQLKSSVELQQRQRDHEFLHKRCSGCGNPLTGPHWLKPFEELRGGFRTTGWRCGKVRGEPTLELWRMT